MFNVLLLLLQVFQKVLDSCDLINGWKRKEPSNTCTIRFRKEQVNQLPLNLPTIPVIMQRLLHPWLHTCRLNEVDVEEDSPVDPFIILRTGSGTFPYHQSLGSKDLSNHLLLPSSLQPMQPLPLLALQGKSRFFLRFFLPSPSVLLLSSLTVTCITSVSLCLYFLLFFLFFLLSCRRVLLSSFRSHH